MVGSVGRGSVRVNPMGVQLQEDHKDDNKSGSSSSSSSSRSSISNRPPKMPPQAPRPVGYQQLMQTMTVYERNICKNVTSFASIHPEFYTSIWRTPKQARDVFADYVKHVGDQYVLTMDTDIEKLGRDAGIEPKERIKYVMHRYEAEHSFFAISGYSKEEVREMLLFELEKRWSEWKLQDFPVFERYQEPQQLDNNNNDNKEDDNHSIDSDAPSSSLSISHHSHHPSHVPSGLSDHSSHDDSEIASNSHKNIRQSIYNNYEDEKSHRHVRNRHIPLPNEYENKHEGNDEDITAYDEIAFINLMNFNKINLIDNNIEGNKPTVPEEVSFDLAPEGPSQTEYEEFEFYDDEEKEHQPLDQNSDEKADELGTRKNLGLVARRSVNAAWGRRFGAVPGDFDRC